MTFGGWDRWSLIDPDRMRERGYESWVALEHREYPATPEPPEEPWVATDCYHCGHETGNEQDLAPCPSCSELTCRWCLEDTGFRCEDDA